MASTGVSSFETFRTCGHGHLSSERYVLNEMLVGEPSLTVMLTSTLKALSFA